MSIWCPPEQQAQQSSGGNSSVSEASASGTSQQAGPSAETRGKCQVPVQDCGCRSQIVTCTVLLRHLCGCLQKVWCFDHAEKRCLQRCPTKQTYPVEPEACCCRQSSES
jgi:hypothetical protein